MIVVFSFTYKSSLHILIFFFCHAAGGILVPPPGIEPTTSALEAQSINHCIQAHYFIDRIHVINDIDRLIGQINGLSIFLHFSI